MKAICVLQKYASSTQSNIWLKKQPPLSLACVFAGGKRRGCGLGGFRQGKRFTAIYDIKAARGPQDDEGAEGDRMERDSS